MYSTHPDSHAIILSHYGQWDDVLVRSSAIGCRDVSRPSFARASFGSRGCYAIRPPLIDFGWGLWHLRLDLGVLRFFGFGVNDSTSYNTSVLRCLSGEWLPGRANLRVSTMPSHDAITLLCAATVTSGMTTVIGCNWGLTNRGGRC